MSQSNHERVSDRRMEENRQTENLPPPPPRTYVPRHRGRSLPRNSDPRSVDRRATPRLGGDPPVLKRNTELLNQITYMGNTINRMGDRMDAMEREAVSRRVSAKS